MKPNPIIDWDATLAISGGDPKMLAELAALFHDDAQRLMDEIRGAIFRQDWHALEMHAHNLKGSLAVFGARTTADAASELEMAGRAGNLAGASAGVSKLEPLIAAVLTELLTHK